MNNCCTGFCHPIAKHFDASIAEKDLKHYIRKGPNPTTRRLRDQILHSGTGDTVLDVGAGIGAASFELLAAGFSKAVAVDMSPAYVAVARNEAHTRGLESHLIVLEGDFIEAAETVPAADTVIMDRVVCCYPQFRPLLERALQHSRRLFAFSYPRDRWYIRLVFAIENVRRGLHRDAFRTVVHSSREMEELIISSGFLRVSRMGTLAWCVDLYHRVAT